MVNDYYNSSTDSSFWKSNILKGFLDMGDPCSSKCQGKTGLKRESVIVLGTTIKK